MCLRLCSTVCLARIYEETLRMTIDRTVCLGRRLLCTVGLCLIVRGKLSACGHMYVDCETPRWVTN